MKIKKFKNFILTIICAGIFVFCSPVCSDFLNLKNLNIFATEPITALAEELEENNYPYEVFNGETLVQGYDNFSDAFSNATSGTTIKIWQDFDATQTYTINNEKTLIIEGNNCTINNKTWGKTIFSVSAGSTLEIKDLTIDGGANTWKIDYAGSYLDGTYARIPTVDFESETKATKSAITSSGNLKANNLSIKNIFTSLGGNNYSGGVAGAGISINAGTLDLTNCKFKHIAGSKGAAVNCAASLVKSGANQSTEYPITSVVIKNSLFEGNHSSGRGAGINLTNVKEASFLNTTFKDNASTRNNGGGIMFDTTTHTWTVSDNGTPDDTSDDIKVTGTVDEYLNLPLPVLTIDNCIFDGNYCGNDGFAIENEGAKSIIKNSQFLRNVGVNDIQGSVGTVSFQTKQNGWVPQLIENCIFDGNKGATSGVGDHASNVDVIIKNTKFSNNQGNTSVLIYNAQIVLEGVEFDNENAKNAVIDARSYNDVDAYSTEIGKNGPTMTLINTSITNTQISDIDIVVRSQNSADNKAPFTVILEGDTKANIQVSNNGELEVNSTTHTGNITVDVTGDVDNVSFKEETVFVGELKQTNKYMLTLIYYNAENILSYKKEYLPEGKVTLLDMQALVNEEKLGHILKWYTSNAHTTEWDYNITNSLSLYGQWVEHQHNIDSFTVKGSSIFESCICGLTLENAKKISISTPDNLVVDGKEKSVILTNTLEVPETDYTIKYYKKTGNDYVLMESLPKELGTYKVVLEYNSLNAELFFDIEQKDNFPIVLVIALCFIGVAIIVAIVWILVKRKNKIKK